MSCELDSAQTDDDLSEDVRKQGIGTRNKSGARDVKPVKYSFLLILRKLLALIMAD